MRRSDRLFQLVQILRGGSVHTAASLARELEISERTLYRDVRDLMASGVPIEGEAGVGYVLNKGFDLPPLMFSRDEIEALVLGARMVEAWADDKLAKSARNVLSKVQAVLPDQLAKEATDVPLFAVEFHVPETLRANLEPVRTAISGRHRLRFDYERGDGECTTRTVRPLGLYFWGKTWTLVSWCEMRGDFRNFRPDRMSRIDVTGDNFPFEETRELPAYLASMICSEGEATGKSDSPS